ncbi:hypothetical protein [Micromonospora sp. DH14]|uniref:hypothetical protein n=1 Tax=Micromonospora sp. DH14 TaxID=3040120 RepID=UPI002442C402|nr:hypothetical protein [Micromonospora sp. DH14]MDG9678324.1 hypothetical protein [Micromonospora sp. DH14]
MNGIEKAVPHVFRGSANGWVKVTVHDPLGIGQPCAGRVGNSSDHGDRRITAPQQVLRHLVRARPTAAGQVPVLRFRHAAEVDAAREAAPGVAWLAVTQAQAVIAAAILRHLHAVITTGQRWDPVIAAHGTTHPAAMPIAA